MSLTTIDFERLRMAPGERVLDLGCGEGRHAITACLDTPVTVIGLDLSLDDLRTARARAAEFDLNGANDRCLGFVSGSGLLLPFADATFDTVICAEVLEHVPDYQAMLLEIKRVLKPGGKLAVSVPRFGPEWICWQLSDAYHQVPGGHVRIFRRGTLIRSIEDLGMDLVGRHFAHGLHAPYWWLRCLFWEQGEDFWPVRLYHRLLVWDLMRKPLLTRILERLTQPLWGKSIVLYFDRGGQHAS